MSDAIKHLTKPVTIIDIFGMLLPGCTAIFLLQNFGVQITKPLEDFFRTDANFLIRLVYLLGLSYLLGNVIHDLSGIIVHALESILLNACPRLIVIQDCWNNKSLINAYQTHLRASMPSDDREKVQAGKDIFRYLQTQPAEISAKLDLSKIFLFNAFSSMGRSMALVCFVAALGFWITAHSVRLTGIALAMVCIFLYRWRHFQKRALQYAYLAMRILG